MLPNSTIMEAPMSESESKRFIEAVKADTALSEKLSAMQSNPKALLDEVKRLGFDCTADEIREEFLSDIGQHLDEKELQDVAAGLSKGAIAGIAVGGTVAAGAAVAGVTVAVVAVSAAAGAAI